MPDDQGKSYLPDDVRGSVAIANFKSIAEQPAMLINLNYANLINNVNLTQENAVSNQQSINQLALTITAKAVNRISNLNPAEANTMHKIVNGDDLAKLLNELKTKIT